MNTNRNLQKLCDNGACVCVFDRELKALNINFNSVMIENNT